MKRKSFFQIAQLVAGPPGDPAWLRPWFICETVITSDGPRTRICNGRWRTEEQAQRALKEKEDAGG